MNIKRLQDGDELLAIKTINILKKESHPSTINETYNSNVKVFLKNPYNYFIVAAESGKPAGFILAYELNRLNNSQSMMLLYEIKVLESKRNQGIAGGMINFLKTICQKKNILKIWTITNKANKAAVRTFESTGGQRVKENDTLIFNYYPENFEINNHSTNNPIKNNKIEDK